VQLGTDDDNGVLYGSLQDFRVGSHPGQREMEDDAETVRSMQLKLASIRQRHQKNRASLIDTFQNLRLQAKDTIEYCGSVGA